ncbi:lytic transglycosylase domain-containing protein [Paraburkholderia sp. UYCP14C]|uniref:lytic transglycosylase domain-containing protein n=1 Tax=Paraburkholderia sp. UYCP14C TaxID=2511130 RepID=UPI00200712CD|nr:lytic transglycosylase domain-containing protein [Paraburkholderia sp. UYCP14C]
MGDDPREAGDGGSVAPDLKVFTPFLRVLLIFFEDFNGIVFTVHASGLPPDPMHGPKHAVANARRGYTLLRLALMIVALALCSLLHYANAQTSGAAEVTEAPPLSTPDDVAAALRAQSRLSAADSLKIAQAVLTEANRYSMPPVLLLSVMAVESGFDSHAVSPVGARGLMQILPAAHPQAFASVKELDDPVVNVRIGSSILRACLDASGGDVNTALWRYSGGGKGYAHRVVMHMQRFALLLRTQKE